MKKFIFILALFAFLFASAYFIPWNRVNWGKFEVLPGSSLTVTGEARKDVQNQIARFSAGITVANQDKQTAIDEVNTKMTKIIKAVKDFGINEKDIQTQTASVNREEEPVSAKTQWRASNNIDIVLRNIDQASALTDLLQSLQATDVYGPSFSVDDTSETETALLQAAIDDAREKAGIIAKASHRQLGKVLTVTEGGVSMPGPIFRMAAEPANSAPVEPGSAQVYQSVTVTFELK